MPRQIAYKQNRGGGWIIALLIAPLISYSILATIAIAILYGRLSQQIHPLEILPDVGTDDPGAKKTGKQSQLPSERIKPTTPLPPKLITRLGQPLTIGDVQVTPEKVELKRLLIHTEGFAKPNLGQNESLVLHVRLKNVSTDLVFAPTDRYFDRKFSSQRMDGAPYTYLEIGNNRFFSGINTFGAKGSNRERVEGQKYRQQLRPGEELSTILCTDSDKEIASVAAKFDGTLLWRVQVRRGLVEFRDKEYSTTAVVGVEFTKNEIQKLAGKDEAE